MLQHRPIEVPPTEVAIERRGKHRHLALGESDNAGLGRAVSHVEEEHVLRRSRVVRQLQRLGQTPAQRRRRRLVHQAQDIQPCNGGSVEDSPSLCISEPARHGDDAVRRRSLVVRLGCVHEVDEKHPQKLLRCVRLHLALAPVLLILKMHEDGAVVALRDLEGKLGNVCLQVSIGPAPPDQTLQLCRSVLDVGVDLGDGCLSKAPFLSSQADHAGSLPGACLVVDDIDTSLPCNRNHTVLVAKVEAPWESHP
mmetsp:Transcript_5489/g.12781  ORF Transcript_5489/g.12781 Transcript_5489/m.12781 type:complete len:252 (-) Transcript_5489:5-760(-)